MTTSRKHCPFAGHPAPETSMNNEEMSRIYLALEEAFHTVKTPVVDLIAVKTEDPFKVLVATMLSARTKDSTTTLVCEKLFKRVNTPTDLDTLTVDELAEQIFPVGFFRQKAIHLKQWPAILRDEFHDRIPDTIDELLHLPGVGRKTANLVLAVAFCKPAVCVDIHVHRIMNRLGYVVTKTPAETEVALRRKLPERYWLNFNSYFVAFGQNRCFPRNPVCTDCPVAGCCRRVNVTTKHPPKKG